MIETKRLQQLHLRAVNGEALTTEEETALKNWYEMLDREEAIINVQSRTINIEGLQDKIGKTTAQITIVSEDVARIIEQNEILRQENTALRRQLESRLTEQAA